VRKHRSLRQTAGAVVASSSGTAALCGAAAVPCSGDSRLSRRGRQGRAARRGRLPGDRLRWPGPA